MHAVVVAGSSLGGELDPGVLSEAGLLVAVDVGAESLAAIGLVPSLLVGDMDSVSAQTRARLEEKGAEIVLLPKAKDETDLEAALRLAVGRGADQITVYGALGGPRLDHLLGNLMLLSAPWLSGVSVRLVDDRHEAFLARGDAEITGEEGDLISFIPLTPEVGDVSTEGLLYPLAREKLSQVSTRSLSNVMTGRTARVTHGSGALLVIRYRGRQT